MFQHANIQSKSVFSSAMTIMDAIHGWEGWREKRPIKSCRTHVELHLRSVDKRKSTQPGKGGGVPEETNDVHYATHKLVFGGTFADHEWVPESTIAQHAEEMTGMEMNNEIGIPCVLQWCMLWLLEPTTLNGTLETQGMKVATTKP